ncbi:hypothetical protein PLANTIT3_60422 [Plantibacter sp. T3]|nr:hypothetical protein PLANTIT3_60422 [Plantibacter sp. T3]
MECSAWHGGDRIRKVDGTATP